MAGVCSNRQIGTLRNPGGHAILFVEARRSGSAADDRHQTYANPLWKYKLFMIGYTHD